MKVKTESKFEIGREYILKGVRHFMGEMLGDKKGVYLEEYISHGNYRVHSFGQLIDEETIDIYRISERDIRLISNGEVFTRSRACCNTSKEKLESENSEMRNTILKHLEILKGAKK